MQKFSDFISGITEEVCRADYRSLRNQEKNILQMASHRAPVPGEGYLRYMAASDIDISLHLKKYNFRWWQKLGNWLFNKKVDAYQMCNSEEAEISLRLAFRRPKSSPLLSDPENNLSEFYAPGKLLEKDWENNVYVVS